MFQSMIDRPHCFDSLMARNVWWSKISHKGSEKEEEESLCPTMPFKTTPPMTSLPPSRPCLLKVPSSPNCAKLGTKSLTPGPTGAFQIQKVVLCYRSPEESPSEIFQTQKFRDDNDHMPSRFHKCRYSDTCAAWFPWHRGSSSSIPLFTLSAEDYYSDTAEHLSAFLYIFSYVCVYNEHLVGFCFLSFILFFWCWGLNPKPRTC